VKTCIAELLLRLPLCVCVCVCVCGVRGREWARFDNDGITFLERAPEETSAEVNGRRLDQDAFPYGDDAGARGGDLLSEDAVGGQNYLVCE
jgi:hypothetical protein